MARRYLLTCLASAIFIFGIARGGHAQEQRPDAFAALEARLARLESNAGSAIDRRSLARAHGELLSLRATVAGMEGVASRDARRRLAKLSNRLRALSQGDAAAVVTAAGTGSISGLVTAVGGAPLAGVVVSAYLIDDGIQTTTTDSAGRYQVNGLASGNYKVLTENRQGFLDELYDDTPCPLGACSRNSQGATVVVTDGQTTGGIDFALSPGGRVAGRVTDAATGAPVAGAQLEIMNADDGGIATAVTDNDGRYVSESGLPTGSYLAVAAGTGYMKELFEDIQCSANFGCDFSSGTPIAVVAGAVTGGIDFALDKGGTISGRVIGSDTGSGIAGVYVVFFNAETIEFASEAYTDADGRYRSFDGLVTGTYYVRVFGDVAGYLDEGYDNIPCDHHCFIPAGVTAVPVTIAQETSGIDFTLERGGVIAGRVTDGNTGQPLSGAVVEAITTTDDPFYNNFGITDDAGVYRIQSLGTGTYRAFYDGRDGYLGEVWKELDCFGTTCFSIPGTPIAVQAGLTTAGIDFTPIRGGSITGRVVDSQTNVPLAEVDIRVYDSAGRLALFSGIATDADGRYRVDGLPSGFYFLVAAEGSFLAHTYVDELYGGLPCPGAECDVTRSRPVRVTVGRETSGVDFELDKGGRISGRITDAITGEPLTHASVNVYDAVTLRLLAFARTDDSGRYASDEALPRGQYLVIAFAPGYDPEEYDNVACEDTCNPRLATRVRVAPPAITTGIDFALDPLVSSAVLRFMPR